MLVTQTSHLEKYFDKKKNVILWFIVPLMNTHFTCAVSVKDDLILCGFELCTFESKLSFIEITVIPRYREKIW